MIENQSDNIDNKENDISDRDNAPEDSSSPEDQIIDNDESSSQKTEEINTEELKNTISNNDARIEQLEKHWPDIVEVKKEYGFRKVWKKNNTVEWLSRESPNLNKWKTKFTDACNTFVKLSHFRKSTKTNR